MREPLRVTHERHAASLAYGLDGLVVAAGLDGADSDRAVMLEHETSECQAALTALGAATAIAPETRLR